MAVYYHYVRGNNLGIVCTEDAATYTAPASGETLTIDYYKNATELSSDTAEPEFDEKYHLAIAYFVLFNLTGNINYKLLYDAVVRTARGRKKEAAGQVKPRQF